MRLHLILPACAGVALCLFVAMRCLPEPQPAAAGEGEEDAAEATDEPEAALRWRRLRWQDEHGHFDADGITAARLQRQQNASYHQSIDDAGIGRFGWTERGPANIGGRTRSLLVHPNNARELWGGSVGGGIWHSTDGGASWAPVDDRFGSLAIGSLAMEPGNPAVIYAGTGEGFYNGDALRGIGILKSTDGGLSFQLLPSTGSFSHVNRIAISSANPQVVLAAVRGLGIMRSADGGQSWSGVRLADNCLQVLFDPNNPNQAVADIYENGDHKVACSTTAGASWNNAQSGLTASTGISGRIELCYAASQPGWIYASCGTGGGLIWRSTDGGANWTQRTTGSGSGASWYYNSLWVDPTDANFLVTGAYHVYSSTDGGVTLTRISNGYIDTSQPHPDVHCFVADPGYDGAGNRRLYVTTDGGVYYTGDIRTASRSSGWSRKDQSYRASQFYGAAGDGASGRITGGTQDNGHLTLQNNSNTASLTYGGDGGFAAIDWQNPNYIYGEYVYAQVHRSSDGGASASYIKNGISDAGSGTTANFIAPLVLDPNAPTRLYVGAASLWVTGNARAASVGWSAIKPAVGSNISAIAVASGNADVVWVGHNNGCVYRTANASNPSPTWIAVDDNGAVNPLPNRYINRILIDAANSSVAYVALGGFSAGNLQRTGDDGATFASVSGSGVTGLPFAPVNGVCQHPTLRDHLYAATEVGVFASADGGGHWSASNDGPCDTSADEVVFLHGSTTLLVATHGRGLWTIPIREGSSTPAGAGCAGSLGVPALQGGIPRVGEALTIAASNLPANTLAWLVVGFSDTVWGSVPLPLDLSPLGLSGCMLHCSLDLVQVAGAPGGVLQSVLPLPADPGLAGATFFAQVLALDPPANQAGAVVSNSLRCVIGH